MLRLILAAVLVSVCLAYPQRRDGAPAEAANLQGFAPGMMQAPQGLQGLQGMQPLQEMPAGLPFAANIPSMGYKRAADENLEERREHSNVDKSAFDSESDPGAFMKFLEDNGNKLPFEEMDGASPDLGNFEPSAENDHEENKFRFFDQQP